MYVHSIKMGYKLYTICHLLTYDEPTLKNFHEKLKPLIEGNDLEGQAQYTIKSFGMDLDGALEEAYRLQ